MEKEELLLKQIDEMEQEKDNLRKSVEELSDKIRAFEDKIQIMKREMERLATVRSLDENVFIIEKLKKENEELRATIDELMRIAYCDEKFGTNTVSAFNKKYSDININPIAVAVVDVFNMKIINDEFNEKVGDGVIRYTLKVLNDMFGTENVYRTRGAQFSILIYDGTNAKIKSMLKIVKDNLYDEKEIEVVCAYVMIDSYSSRKTSYEKLQTEMKVARIEKKVSDVLTVEKIIETSQECADEIIDNKKGEEKQEGNPNIAAGLYEDLYNDVEVIHEVESTSIDMALEIMNMHAQNN